MILFQTLLQWREVFQNFNIQGDERCNFWARFVHILILNVAFTLTEICYFLCDSQIKDSGGETEGRHHVSAGKCHPGGCYHEADSSLFATPSLPHWSGQCHRDTPANARREYLAQLDSKTSLSKFDFFFLLKAFTFPSENVHLDEWTDINVLDNRTIKKKIQSDG